MPKNKSKRLRNSESSLDSPTHTSNQTQITQYTTPSLDQKINTNTTEMKSALEEKLDNLTKKIDQITNRYELNSDEIKYNLLELLEVNKELRREVKEAREENNILKDEIKILKKSLSETKEEINNLEQWSRRSNVRVLGISENNKEDYRLTEEKVINLFRNSLDIDIKSNDIDIAHRVGVIGYNKHPRPILVKLTNRKKKIEIMKNKKNLKGTNVFVTEDLTRANAKLLKDIKTQKCVKYAWSREGKLYARGEEGGSVEVSQSMTMEQLTREIGRLVDNSRSRNTPGVSERRHRGSPLSSSTPVGQSRSHSQPLPTIQDRDTSTKL